MPGSGGSGQSASSQRNNAHSAWASRPPVNPTASSARTSVPQTGHRRFARGVRTSDAGPVADDPRECTGLKIGVDLRNVCLKHSCDMPVASRGHDLSVR